MNRLSKKVLVFALVFAVAVGLVMPHASAATFPEVRIDQEPLYKTLVRVISTAKVMYVEDVPIERMLLGAVKGALSALDPYTTYFAKSDLQTFKDSTIGDSFGGIGINIEIKDGYVTVVSPLRGTPAEAAGLRAGDRIIEVDGKSIKGVSVDTASSLIRGVPGTKVNLKVWKASGETIDLSITRATIKMESVTPEIIEGGKIGVFRIDRFTMTAGTELSSYMDMMKEAGVQGFIIDLRDNPGGLLQSALDVLESVMPKGIGLNVIDRSGKPQAIPAGSDVKLLPTVMLINGGSASASEVVAGAVKDYGTAFIMGEKSFGKGSIQQLIDFPDGDGMKITIAHYLTPFMNKIDGIGVTPDLMVNPTWDDPMKAPPFVTPALLKDGDKGLAVDQLERALVALGYEKKAVGAFDKSVSAAISSFQKAISIAVTGNLDSYTAARLNHELAAKGIGGLDRQMYEAVQMLKMKGRIGW